MTHTPPDVARQTDEEFYQQEMDRAAAVVRQMVKERNEARDMCRYLVAAAGGEIVVTPFLLVQDVPGVEIRHDPVSGNRVWRSLDA